MKRKGIINKQLAGCIASLGHKDLFMICDGGMPLPKDVEVVDLALVGGVPTFKQAMEAVLDEAGVEEYYLAEEIKANNPKLLEYIQGKLKDVPCTYVPHEPEFKELSKKCKFIVRTGEFSVYPNIILKAFCSFQ